MKYTPEGGRHLHQRLAIIAAVGVLFAVTAALAGAGIVDDAYIFLRYVRNIWSGAGPVFNAGARVEGYTSPLWLFVLAVAKPVPLAAPALAVLSSAICGFAAILLVAFWRRPTGREGALLGAVFLASNPVFTYWTWSGMDTAIFTLCLLLMTLTAERDLRLERVPIRTGLAFGIATLARLEALWLAPVVILTLVLGRRGIRSATVSIAAVALPLLVIVGPHVLWRHAYYGSWLPNTFYAKLDIPEQVLLGHGVAYLKRTAFLTLPVLLMSVIGLRREHPDGRYAPLYLASILWWSIYVLFTGGDHFPFARFFVPAIGLAAVILGPSVTALLKGRAARDSLAIAALLVVCANWLQFTTDDAALARAEVVQTNGWARTGQWCASELPDGTIATLVVGAIPYYCNRETYDLLGLVDAYVARQGRVHPESAIGHQKWATEYVISKAPDYIFFPTSGVVTGPTVETLESRYRLPSRTHQALIDLVTNPDVLARYQYRAQPLGNGFWVELLQRRREQSNVP